MLLRKWCWATLSDFKEPQVRLTQNWKGKKIPYFGYWISELRLRCKWEQSKADLICAILSKMSKTLSGNEKHLKALVPSGDNSAHGPWLTCKDVEFHTFLLLFFNHSKTGVAKTFSWAMRGSWVLSESNGTRTIIQPKDSVMVQTLLIYYIVL